mgnify:CR=1 FL=1
MIFLGAGDGRRGLEEALRGRYDVVLLDLMLPGLDGLEVCRRIQADRPVPVIMLTARDSEADLVLGLQTGADDYMTKPFSTRELVARVQAMLRRVDRLTEPAAADAPTVVLGPVTLDPVTHRATVDGAEVHLTPTEFDLARTLAASPERVFTREELLAEVWGYEVASGERTVDSHIRSLRRKLGADAIRTVHGVGYACAAVAS